MSKNVILINPAVNPGSQNPIIRNMIVSLLPTSLGTLAGFLEDVGINGIEIIDEQVDFIGDKDLPNLIANLKEPKIVGLSVLTINSKRAFDLADKIKKIDPDVTIVFGNIHPTVLPEEALNKRCVDIVVRGEGEITFTELIRSITNSSDYKDLWGISYKNNGMIIHNPDRPLIKNLDQIPVFPFHLFEKNIDKYHAFGVLITSRGCPFACKFCSSRNISGREYRYFSVERVFSEIKILVEKYKQNRIWLIDDNLAANPHRFNKLLDLIIKEKINKKAEFHGSMRGDSITDEILDKAKLANFRMITYGLETTSETLMKVIDKGETVEQVINAIEKTSKKGIVASATLIFGLPKETRKDRRQANRLVQSLPLSSVRFNTLIPYPGTSFFEELNSQGKLDISQDWKNFAVQYMWEGDNIPYVPDGNNRYELLFDAMSANFSFYLSFKGIRRMLNSSFAGGNVIQFEKNWYFSPIIIFRLLRLFLYLLKRFIYVTFKCYLIKFNKTDN